MNISKKKKKKPESGQEQKQKQRGPRRGNPRERFSVVIVITEP